MSILFFQEGVQFDWKAEEVIRQWIIDAIQHELDPVEIGDISIVFCSDEFLLDINTRFLQHDFYTDIVTFEYSRKPLTADLYISIDRVSENSRLQSVGFYRELYRVIIHGILHLCGYKDKSESEQAGMRSREDHYLGLLPLQTEEI